MAPTGFGKTHLALDMLEREYINYFDFVVILFPTLKHNKMYRRQKWFWTDLYVTPLEPGNHLYNWIEKLGNQ